MDVSFWTFFTFLSFFFDSVGILEKPDSYRYKTIGLSADKFTIQQYCEELTKQLSPMTFKVIWHKYVNMKAKSILLCSPHFYKSLRIFTLLNKKD